MSSLPSATSLRVERAQRLATLTLAAAGIVVLCVGLGWVVVERGPLVAFAPVLLVAAGAGSVAGLTRPYVVLIALAVLISAFPIARVLAGGIPLYFTDVLAALVLAAVLISRPERHVFHLLIGVYILTWLPAWVYQVARTDLYLEPTYGLGRNLLAVAVSLAAFEIVRRRRDAALGIVLALAAGTTVTAIITLAQAIPATSGATRSVLFTIAPEFVENGYVVYPERAFALFQAPTTLSGFLACMLPLFVVAIAVARGRARTLLAIAAVLAGLALIATYSRQWAPALALGLLALAALRPAALGRLMVVGAVVLTVIAFAFSSGSLDSAYLSERFSGLGSDDANVQLRLKRQREFFALVDASSADTLLGRGFAGQDIDARDLTDLRTTEALRSGVNDNSFLLEWFNHGLLAGILYFLIVVGVIAAAAREARRRTDTEATLLAGLAAALVTAAALHFFDNYFSESVFMKTLLWAMLGAAAGLVAAQRAALDSKCD
jgi:hypothetical protein